MVFPSIFRRDTEILPAVPQTARKASTVCAVVPIQQSLLSRRDDELGDVHGGRAGASRELVSLSGGRETEVLYCLAARQRHLSCCV